MTETMHDCYLTQFENMGKILDTEGFLDDFAALFLATQPDRLYLVGSGTSLNACAAAAPLMQELLGIEVTAQTPTTLGKLFARQPMAIAISQGGRSTNTEAAVTRLRGDGVPVVTLTDPADSPVGRAATLALDLHAADEKIGPKTRGYMASVLTLYLMALKAARAADAITTDTYEGYLAGFRRMVANGPACFEACQAFYDRHLEALKNGRHFLFVGKGIGAQVANEDALKVIETLCWPSAGYEFEEFLHGPDCCVDDKLVLFLFLPEDDDKQRMLRLAEIMGEGTDTCYVISHDPSITGDKVLYIPSADPVWHAPFTDVLFGQLISAVLTEELGRKRHPLLKNISSVMATKVQ